jgi:predicted Fe-Mo cluster-binding NifX family protein
VKIAIPRFGEAVAPCFEYSATIAIFTVEDGKVVSQRDFTLQSQQEFDRVRLLRDQGVNTLICGGVQDRFEDVIKALGIQVISWVSGDVENLIDQFLRGKLTPGTGRLGDPNRQAG